MPAESSSSPASGIHTPGSIWQKAVEQKASAKAVPKAESHVYFVGGSSSGKSTLISRFLYPNKVEAAKPSPGLEYTFARKAAAFDANRRDTAHFWELAGSDALTAQLTQGSHIFLTHRQVTTAAAVVVLDLSDPSNVIPTALHWLDLIRIKLAATYALFEKRGLQQLPQQLKTRQHSKQLGQQHPDAQLVDCPGVPLLFVCTKWDTLRNSAEPEGLRVLAHTLRWLAHSNCAHLMCVGGLQPGAAAGGESAKLLDSFSRLLSHMAFVGMDKKIPLKQPPSTDHLGPLLVLAGSDSYSSIGLPHGGSSSSWDANSIAAGQQQWLEACNRLWPSSSSSNSSRGAAVAAPPKQKQQEQQQQVAVAFSAPYQEEEVDAAYAQREAALEAYMQEQEGRAAQQRRARRKVAAATAVPGGS